LPLRSKKVECLASLKQVVQRERTRGTPEKGEKKGNAGRPKCQFKKEGKHHTASCKRSKWSEWNAGRGGLTVERCVNLKELLKGWGGTAEKKKGGASNNGQ